MKTARKVLLLLLCAALLVSASIMGTMAYLTDNEAVVNTFTVGNVAITLDEAKVDENGVAVSGADRVKANEYHLLPGKSYTKDPIVHVDEDSESAWIFIKVENDIAAIEGATTVASQIKANGWTELTEGAGVYYKQVLKTDPVKDLEVFETISIAGTVNNATLATYEGKTVTITAYAIQLAGFEDAPVDAWNAVSAAYTAQG